jgi:hypothetical protein
MSRADMLKDLKRSGLTAADAKKANYHPLTAEKTKKLTGIYAASYFIPYHDVKGRELEFWRVRFTEKPLGAFGTMTKKPPRYSQLKNTLPRFYFPARVDWKHLNADVGEPLAITEGEKKAEKACKEGIPCIAVGGVWAWRSKKKGIPAIKDFDSIKWKGRKVWLVFDNDLMTNPLVIGALAGLSKELHQRGAKVVIKYLPKGPGKIGLDDYLVKRKNGAQAFIKLREEPYKASEHLWQLNDRLAFIGKVNAYWDFKYSTMYGTKSALIQQFDNVTYQEPKANGKGFTIRNAAEQWSKWENRRQYDDIGYFPGDEPVVQTKINTWPGWGVKPERGDVRPFLDLIDYLFEGEDDLRTWFLKWLAYPLQNPGEKCLTGLLLHSNAQGVGKSFVGYIMGDIYGENFNVVSQEELQSAFNDWVVSKQFILGEEITGNNSRREADRLKNMLTREKLNVSIKYQPGYVMDDCANYLFTSNHVDALHLETADRRIVVHEIKSKPRGRPFYKRVDRWRHSGGPSALFYYLLNDVDVSDFDPKDPAPASIAKTAMISVSMSALDLFAQDLRENPNNVLRNGTEVVKDELLTLTRIKTFANRATREGPHSSTAVSKSLRRADFRMYVVFTCDGTKRLWAVRNRETWAKRTSKEMAEYYARINKAAKIT